MTARALLLGVLVGLLLVLAGCADDNVDPAKNDHAKHCVENGFHIKTHDQFGGKYSTTTYWCARTSTARSPASGSRSSGESEAMTARSVGWLATTYLFIGAAFGLVAYVLHKIERRSTK